MGFDSVIVNPIIGENELRSFVRLAHNFGMGVISLAYMSHENVSEGYGLKIVQSNSKVSKILRLYEIFLKYARRSNVDGIVVGVYSFEDFETYLFHFQNSYLFSWHRYSGRER